ncbi:hypothetical protein ZWY2020_047987 [Hordeum vulgare]|nr:hypothetical protein ZWY2020_047987 [Hordeum vulgare]
MLCGNNVSLLFEVRKVLMRTTPDDIVAVMTNNYNYPIILVRPGKGVWLPRPRSAPFIYIIDIVFIGDILYGITKAEDLISLDIAFGVDGTPIITRTKRVIRNPSKIVESLGKLLMVRWMHHPLHGRYYTRSAYVFEANINVGAWVPVKDGLGGQALFISRYYCKSVRASGDVEKDAVYFADTGRSAQHEIQDHKPATETSFQEATWLFPPDPIV